MAQGNQGCRRHLPGTEVQRHHERDEQQEDDERLERLLTDRRPPGGADEGRADVLVLHTKGLDESGLDLRARLIGESLGLDPDRAGAELGDVGRVALARAADGFACLGLVVRRSARGRHPELGSAAELDIQHQKRQRICHMVVD